MSKERILAHVNSVLDQVKIQYSLKTKEFTIDIDIDKANKLGFFDGPLDTRWQSVRCSSATRSGYPFELEHTFVANTFFLDVFVVFREPLLYFCTFDQKNGDLLKSATIHEAFRKLIEPLVGLQFSISNERIDNISLEHYGDQRIRIKNPSRHSYVPVGIKTDLRISMVNTVMLQLDENGASEIAITDPFLYPVQKSGIMHAMVDSVVALSSLDFPAYVLLWIFNWLLEYSDKFFTEYQKITLIVNTINSIRRVRERRNQLKALR